MKELFFVEWSEKFKNFHIGITKNNLINININQFIKPKEFKSDWIVLGLFKTEKEANQFCNKIQNLRKTDIAQHTKNLIHKIIDD